MRKTKIKGKIERRPDKVPVFIRLNKDDADLLKKAAAKYNYSFSGLCRVLLEKAIEEVL